MFTKSKSLGRIVPVLVAVVALTPASLRAAASETERLEKLERAVEQLQKRNAELEAEVRDLKAHKTAARSESPDPPKAKGASEAKSYVAKPFPTEKTEKWKLSNALTELEIYGDARLRYEYRGGETDHDSPVARPGVGVAGRDDWQERERERYRLRIGLRGTLLDDWFFGVRLETGQNPRSTNVTFGDDTSGSAAANNNLPWSKTNDGINVGQAYVGYKGFSDFTFMGGRMPQPLVTTKLLWDEDINPEGLAEQWKHTFVFGADDESLSLGKDGTGVVAPAKSEPFLQLDVFANFAQFVYDDANPENPLGRRATTTGNGGSQRVPNSDAWMLAWQIGARANFRGGWYAQIAPSLFNYTGNGDTFNIHFQGGDPGLTNAASLAQNQQGINSLLILAVPWEVGGKVGQLPVRLLGDFAVNLDGDDRAAAAGHPDKGDQRYAFSIGAAVGQLKRKHDWQISVFWQRQDQYSVDPNLVDTEFWDSKLNLQGIGVTAGYMITDAVSANILYGHAWRADDDLGTGGLGDIGINPLDEYDLLQLDLNVRF